MAYAKRSTTRYGCSEKHCSGDHHALGLCHTHYTAQRREEKRTEDERLRIARGLDPHSIRKRLVQVAKNLTERSDPDCHELWQIIEALDLLDTER